MSTTTILQFADVHFGSEDPEALAAVAKVEDTFEPDVVVVCGDVTQTGSTEEFEAAQAWLEGFSAPILATPGNHDAPYFQPVARVFDPYGRFETHIASLSRDMYVDDRVAIQCLNSARAIQAKLDWSVGAVDMDELEAKVRRFKVDAPDRLHFLGLHHPLIYPPESPLDKTTDNGPEALERLSDAGCDAVLTGHIHIPFVKDREPGRTGLLSIGAGTLSTRRRGVEPSFNIIEVDTDGVGVSAVTVTQGRMERQATWRKSRDAFA